MTAQDIWERVFMEMLNKIYDPSEAARIADKAVDEWRARFAETEKEKR